MATLTPLITSAVQNYNFGMAETYSYVPVQNSERLLFAKAVYNVNSPNQNGFVITSDTSTIEGKFSSIKTITTTRFSGITAENSSIPSLAFDFPANFVIEGPITAYKLSSGAVMALKG